MAHNNPLDQFMDPNHPLIQAIATTVAIAVSEASNPHFDQINTRFQQVDASLDQINVSLNKIDASLTRMDASFDRMDAGFDRMDAGFDRMDASFNRIDARLQQNYMGFNQFEVNMNDMNNQLAAQQADMNNQLAAQQANMNNQLAAQQVNMNNRFDQLEVKLAGVTAQAAGIANVVTGMNTTQRAFEVSFPARVANAQAHQNQAFIRLSLENGEPLPANVPFPADYHDLLNMTGQQIREVLDAYGIPIPPETDTEDQRALLANHIGTRLE